MEELLLQQVAETGRLLLEKRLVARTWGNFSARLDETHFAITPSGLGYEQMTAEDIVRCCLRDGTYGGSRKPSSERGIHAAAYRLFPEVGFVIHTHQTYATALGLTQAHQLAITSEERDRLGGVGWAAYGLPGTKKLKNNVSAAMEQGAQTVLMAHHGALVCGRDREDALAKASLLEDICRRSCRGQMADAVQTAPDGLLARIRETHPLAEVENSSPVLAWASLREPLPAQLDDMAQMIGRRIPAAQSEDELMRLLGRYNAVLLPGLGAMVQGEDADDTVALRVLTQKAAVAALHSRASRQCSALGIFDCALMHRVYRMKYSKQKKG